MITKLFVSVLVNNFVSTYSFKGEHGLSLLVTIEENGSQSRILWDTGQTPEILISNLKALDVDPDSISVVALSHGHYDHTGGLLGFLDSRQRNIEVLSSSFSWGDRFNSISATRNIGSGLTREDVSNHGGDVIEVTGPYYISDHFILTGSVEKLEPCEMNQTFARSSGHGVEVDNFMDDMSLIINLGDSGLFILTGCCHSGIINTVNYCRKITGINKIRGILGGLHLINASASRLNTTKDFLAGLNCDFLAPIHCSGLEETCFLRHELGDAVKFTGTGETIQIV